MSNAAIDFIAANPRATAKEAGLTNAEANALVGQGKLVAVGNRVTGKRGRPPMEYIVAGTDLTEDSMAQASVQEAVERVERHRHYERLSSRMMQAYHEFGYGSPEHVEAKANRKDAFPVPPVTPSKNDYVLAGSNLVDAPPAIESDTDVLVEA